MQGPSRTKQSEAEEADINTIVRRFNLTGQMPTNIRTPQYGDFDGIESFQDAMDRVRQAQENFMLIPAEIRAKFGNDPGAFVEYATNPDNLPELRKMGLARDIPAQATPVPTPRQSRRKGPQRQPQGHQPGELTDTNSA